MKKNCTICKTEFEVDEIEKSVEIICPVCGLKSTFVHKETPVVQEIEE